MVGQPVNHLAVSPVLPPRNEEEAETPSNRKYTFFYKKESPFSQWYPSVFIVDGVQYSCAEQCMMHKKALLFKDSESAKAILDTPHPYIMKRLGRRVEPWRQEAWDQECIKVVASGNYAKFSQNPDLRRKLLATGDTILVEASPFDTVWGIGLAEDHPDVGDEDKWRGKNLLGLILTALRDRFREEEEEEPLEVGCLGIQEDRRAFVQLNLGGVSVKALVDSGASRTLLREDVMKEIFRRSGRPAVLSPVGALVSLTEHDIGALGATEVSARGIGPIAVTIVRSMRHQMVLGWDQLVRHGVCLDSSQPKMKWGCCELELQHAPGNVPALAEVTVDSLVERYPDVFGALAPRLPATDLLLFRIITNGPPVRQRAYRTPLAKRKIVEEEISKMLAEGIIRPSSSEYASPVVLVPKKDGGIRFCVSYQRLNAITERDCFPLPLIQDIFDQLGGSRVFSTLDLTSSYWQVKVHPDSVPKTAFISHVGLYEFLRMPFGLVNAPSAFQRLMQRVLQEYLGKFVFVYIDDIIIYSPDKATAQLHLDLVIQKIEEAGLTLKPSKCEVMKDSLSLLGFIVSGDGISPDPAKTAAIRNLEYPIDVSEVRRFLGMANYYSRCVPEYARIAEPLTRLTRKKEPWIFGDEQKTAFNTLKEGLTSEQVMAYPKINEPYILYTDASQSAVGAILVQEDQEGLERPIQYISQQLSSSRRRYPAIEKEAYAVVWALKKLRPYLLGSKFVVYTDHKPLTSLFTKDFDNTKIERWAVLLNEYGAKVLYRPGRNNIRADMLSRIRAPEVAILDDGKSDIPLEYIPLKPEDVSLLADGLTREEVSRLQQEQFPELLEEAKDEDSRYTLVGGLLYSVARPQPTDPEYPRLVLPLGVRAKVIERCHTEVGHMSVLKTLARIQEAYVWSGMRREVKEQLRKCGRCLVHTSRKVRVPMGEMPLASYPGQIIGVDLIGSFTPAPDGSNYVLTVIDHCSGWGEAYPLVGKTNKQVWDRLQHDYFPRHGYPEVLISDQGLEFNAGEFKEYLKGVGVAHHRTTSYHPQSNGRSERFNKTLKEIIRKLVDNRRGDWLPQLSVALTAYRIAKSTTTGYSPFFLHHGRHPRVPLSKMLAPEDPERTFQNRLEALSEAFRRAKVATAASRTYNRERLARRATAGELRVGDSVIIVAQEAMSMTARWDHQYTVVRQRGAVFDVRHQPSGTVRRLHRDKLRLVDSEAVWTDISLRPRRSTYKRRPVPQIPAEALQATKRPAEQSDSHIPSRRDQGVYRPLLSDGSTGAMDTTQTVRRKRTRSDSDEEWQPPRSAAHTRGTKREAEDRPQPQSKPGLRRQAEKRGAYLEDPRSSKLGPRVQGEKRPTEEGEEYRRRLRPRRLVQLNPRRGYAEGGDKRRAEEFRLGEAKKLCADEQGSVSDQVAALVYSLHR